MTSPLSHLLARGYFPKELPPPFNTKSFGTFAETAPAVFHLDTTKKGLKNNLTTARRSTIWPAPVRCGES
jgi:hypothetical protein